MIFQAYFSLNNSLFKVFQQVRNRYFILEVNVCFPIYLKFKFHGIILEPNCQICLRVKE